MSYSKVRWLPLRVILAVALLGVLHGVACGAQQIFPSDGEDPRQGGALELLETVCPGRVASGKEVKCRIPCPSFTGFPGENFGWSLTRVTRGHFLSPTSEDAVLSMEGCESHASNFGGTILLTRRSNGWKMIWYKSGVCTAQCHKVPLRNGREILVCMGKFGGQGNNFTALYVEDLLTATATLMAGEETHFFQVFDNTSTCGWNSENESEPYPLRAPISRTLSSSPATAAAGRRYR